MRAILRIRPRSPEWYRPSMPREWPFDQARNAAAITLRRIVDGERPILVVSHDEDDHGWQFLDGLDIAEADAAVVAMEEVAKLDPSVLEVADLPPGFRAYRMSREHAWVREARGSPNVSSHNQNVTRRRI